jgi:hypothetical protein
MSDAPAPDPVSEREAAQKFVQFIMVQAQNVLYVLGKIPGPDGQAPPPNLEAAKMLIDQLEIIKLKTKGNLSPQEEQILDDTLQEIRLAFVEASGGTPASMMPDRSPNIDLEKAARDKEEPSPEPEAPQPQDEPKIEQPSPPAEDKKDDDDNDKKRFVKSYG